MADGARARCPLEGDRVLDRLGRREAVYPQEWGKSDPDVCSMMPWLPATILAVSLEYTRD